MKKKSAKNKTIDFNTEEGKLYIERCLTTSQLTDTIDINNKTILGDFFEVALLLPKGTVDLLIADPPYNLSKNFHGNTFRKTSLAEYASYTEKWIQQIIPLLKPNASIYVCCDWQTSIVLGEVLTRYFHVHNRITWQREKGRGAEHNWKNGMEDIWFASNSKDYTFNIDKVKIKRKVIAPYKENGKPKDWTEGEEGKYRDTCPSNFWDDLTIPFWSMPENTAHPTQKPEKLLAKLILASSNEGDLVFDPFLGSGTTSVVAKKLGRKYLGIEQNELYCGWAEKRLEDAGSDSSIQGYMDGIFWERNTHSEQRLRTK